MKFSNIRVISILVSSLFALIINVVNIIQNSGYLITFIPNIIVILGLAIIVPVSVNKLIFEAEFKDLTYGTIIISSFIVALVAKSFVMFALAAIDIQNDELVGMIMADIFTGILLLSIAVISLLTVVYTIKTEKQQETEKEIL